MPHTISRTATAEKRTEERIFSFALSLSADRLRKDFSFSSLSEKVRSAGKNIKNVRFFRMSDIFSTFAKALY